MSETNSSSFQIFDGECEVAQQKEIANRIFELKLNCFFASEVLPGQFVNILIPKDDLPLRRPISVCQVVGNSIVLTYRIEGEGTKELAKLKSGSSLQILGPLGNGFDLNCVSSGETALIVGGGIGVPPLLELAKQLNRRGVLVQSFLGFASENAVIYESEFAKFGEVFIATDDGSCGFKGHAISLIENIFGSLEVAAKKAAAVYSCGPTPLLRAVDREFGDHSNAFVSLESRMACGIGACYACVQHISGDETKTLAKKVCDQGPVFKTGEVIF